MLSEIQIKSAKPGEKPYKLVDGGGFYLFVSPAGGKSFRLDYQFAGKRKTLTIGKYPDTKLIQARTIAQEARQAIASGLDPSDKKRVEKIARHEQAMNTYGQAYAAWLAKESPSWVHGHTEHVKARQTADVMPWLGKRPMAAITAPEILSIIKKIVPRSNDIAHRALSDIKRVFDHAIASGVVTLNPAAGLTPALPAVEKDHFAAITDPAKLADFLKSIPALRAKPAIKTALWMAPRVAVRPIELRQARWADINLDAATWCYTPQKTQKQTGTELIVPLAKQVVAALRELQPITGEGVLVFPGVQRSKCISESALNVAMIRLGWDRKDTTVHGFRATFRTLADEVLGFRIEHIEQQLGHQVRDMHGRAYNRTRHLDQRRNMMQVWADYLDALAEGKETDEFRQA